MLSIIRVVCAFCLFCAVAAPVYAGQTGLQSKAVGDADCTAGRAAGTKHRQPGQLAGKICKHGRIFDLTVTLGGTGSGRVSSDPAGIYCQVDCSEDYARNTKIVLSAQPYSGSVFTGWSGACSGTAPCSIKLKADTTVIATFVRVEPLPPSLVTPYVDEADMREINDYFNAQYDDLPWGRIHDGLDMDPDGNLRPYRSACAGRVGKIYVFDNQVTLIIDCDATYSIDYNFETQAPNTGQIQLGHILVSEGQTVARGETIGYLYSAENPDRAHVHFTLYQNAVPVCPEPFFTPAARASILNLVAVAHQDVMMCRSGNAMPPPLVTPYRDELDMARITAGFSTAYSVSPWDFPHGGLDIYPRGDLTPWQAACSGKIDALELRQSGSGGDWQVEVAVVCAPYVPDPDSGGYFIPLTAKYYFQTRSADPAVGQAQLANIVVSPGQSVTEGDIIGYLKAANPEAHLQFDLLQFGQSEFQVFGVTGIPQCPQAHFSPPARASILNLLHAAWPGAEACYH